MSVRPVLLWPDARLRAVCDGAGDVALVEDLFDTMYAANGRGLAAPQIGELSRVFVVDVSWKEGARDPRAFVNPVVERRGEDIGTMEEQCLSIPEFPMAVARPLQVTLSWDGSEGRLRDTFDGILARCIQHELDHLDGKVIFDHQTPEKRAALEALYAS